MARSVFTPPVSPEALFYVEIGGTPPVYDCNYAGDAFPEES